MIQTKEQVLSFLEKCEEMKSCKFIMATTKIKDLLKCIVNCPELYRLFEAVTKDFNYLSVKSRCLVSVNDGLLSRNYIILPKTVGERLAFIFCLLVEFDKETMSFNDFLRLYFPEDGSYFASYQAFCNTVIKGLAESIAQVFKEELDYEVSDEGENIAEIFSALGIAVAREIEFISASSIIDEEKENGVKILTAILKSLKEGDDETTDALLCGYNYFVLYNNCISDGITELIKLIEVCEKAI